jgi:hypothetical protein
MNAKATTIEALLRKAESSHSTEEAEAFTAKAEELMVKYGIDAAMLQAKEKAGSRKEEVVSDGIQFTGTYTKPLLMGAHLLVMGLTDAIVTYRTGDRGNMRLGLVGFESDIARAKTLIASIQLQAIAAMERWWKAEGRHEAMLMGATSREQLVRRRGFIQGYFAEAGSRLRALRTRVEAEAGAGTAVALVDRAALVRNDEAVRRLGLGKGRKSRGWATDYSGQRAGRAAGANADIGQTRVGGQGRALGA